MQKVKCAGLLNVTVEVFRDCDNNSEEIQLSESEGKSDKNKSIIDWSESSNRKLIENQI